MSSHIRILFFIGLLGPIQSSALPGICGQFDLRDVPNSIFITQLAQRDFNKSMPARVQCGLFSGENLPICVSCADDSSQESMELLRPIIGSADHLAWHSEWHKIRAKSSIDQSTLDSYVANGLVPPDTTIESFKPHLAGGKLNGEDFLYMHRLMLKMAQLELSYADKPCFAPWNDLPESVQDPVWPVPRTFKTPGALQKAQKTLDQFRKELAAFKNLQYLSGITLNQLGSSIEPILHQGLHAFYRDENHCSPESLAAGYCDDLLPPETSPLNKHFWKIHGMIDTLIGYWLTANGYREIAADEGCDTRPGCYRWKGTWVGKYPH